MKRFALALFPCSALAAPIAAHAGASADDGPVSGLDEQWLQMSTQGDYFEIESGRMALQKSSNPLVRKAAAQIAGDHQKSLIDAKALAARLHVSLPDNSSPTQQWELRVLTTMSDGEFDHWWAMLEVNDHIQDIEEARNEVSKGTNADIRAMAREEIPTLQLHLKLARQAYATTK